MTSWVENISLFLNEQDDQKSHTAHNGDESWGYLMKTVYPQLFVVSIVVPLLSQFYIYGHIST